MCLHSHGQRQCRCTGHPTLHTVLLHAGWGRSMSVKQLQGRRVVMQQRPCDGLGQGNVPATSRHEWQNSVASFIKAGESRLASEVAAATLMKPSRKNLVRTLASCSVAAIWQ